MRPNIMLVVLDTARADAFEPYGAPSGASPALATIAADGDHVPEAYATGSWTVPSHVSMFTGQLSRAVGLGRAPSGTFESTRPRMEVLRNVMLPEVFRRAGYRTAGVSCNAWISPAGGWDLGFDSFEFISSPRGHPKRTFSRGMARWLWHSTVADIDDGARAAEDRLKDWFARWDGRDPFFWFVNLVECHSPYLPPEPYNELPTLERLRASRDARRYQSFEGVLKANLGKLEVPAASVARMRHLYARSILSLDGWVERVAQLLDARGVLDDTILVVTSDHGENFGENGRFGHAMSLDDRLVRVPFIVRGPVSVSSDAPWSTLGLPALLADAAGVAGPWEAFESGRPVPVQFDPPGERDDEIIRKLVADWHLDEEAVRLLTEPQTCVVADGKKLLQHGDERTLFDLVEDPLECAGLPGDVASENLRAALADDDLWAQISETSPPVRDGGGTIDPDDRAALEEQMRLLGYM